MNKNQLFGLKPLLVHGCIELIWI